jgi:hypothetical protein
LRILVCDWRQTRHIANQIGFFECSLSVSSRSAFIRQGREMRAAIRPNRQQASGLTSYSLLIGYRTFGQQLFLDLEDR